MAGKQFRKSSAFAALAIGLAVAALPAAAQDRGGRGEGRGGWAQSGGERSGGDSGRGGNWRGSNGGGERGGDRSDRQERQQVQAPSQVQPSAPRGEQRQGGFWGAGRGGDAGRERQGGFWGAGRDGQGAAVAQHPVQRPSADGGRNRTYTPRDGDRRWDGDRREGREVRRGDGDRRWDGNRQWDGNRRWDGNRATAWSRDWRRDNRYDWRSWRNAHRGSYNLGRYHSPYRDWSYRRLGIGFTLQPLFFSQNYWIADPWSYRLPEAYGPYRWVRYYDDALLVNIYDGEVVDVIYDFFW